MPCPTFHYLPPSPSSCTAASSAGAQVGERRRQAEGGRRCPGRFEPMGDLGAEDQRGGSAAEEHAGGEAIEGW